MGARPTPLRVLAAAMALAAGLLAAARAQEDGKPTLEYQVKCAYLYNFLQFVEWPEDSFKGKDDPVVVAVLGEDRFGAALDALEGREVGGRRIRVRRLRSTADLEPCHLLFVPASEDERYPRIFAAAEKKAILTVGETRGFATAGGIVGFIHVGDKIRFEINVDAAGRARLRVSSKLLRLAVVVHDPR